MAAIEYLSKIDKLLPFFISQENIWAHYDSDADVLYLHFKKPNHADDSELTDENVIVRYEQGEIIGLTILNASKRAQMVH